MEALAVIQQVWHLEAFGAAIVAGLLLGTFDVDRSAEVLEKLGLPSLVRERVLSVIPVVTLVSGWRAGAVFYLTQAIVEWVISFDNWPRVLARSVIFMTFIAAMSVGMWFKMKRRRYVRTEAGQPND